VRSKGIKLGLLAGIVAVAVAGCGGSSGPLTKSEYVKKMNTISADLSRSMNRLGSVADPKSAADELQSLQAELGKTAKQLDSIRPPTDIERANTQLSGAASQFAAELGPIITRLKAGDMTALGDVTSLTAFKKLQAANEQLRKKGYRITS
jgi:hypothetical protein